MSEDIESAQKNQKKIGSAEDDQKPQVQQKTFVKKLAEMTDKDQDEKEPAEPKGIVNYYFL